MMNKRMAVGIAVAGIALSAATVSVISATAGSGERGEPVLSAVDFEDDIGHADGILEARSPLPETPSSLIDAVGADAPDLQSVGRPLQIYLRRLEQLQATPLSGTADASSPFFSPDGRWIAFFADGKLKKMAADGGPVQVICDAPSGRGGTWGRNGDILFAHACKLGCEGIVSKRLGSPYRSGRSPHWVKVKNPKAPAVRREAEEDWGKRRPASAWITVRPRNGV